MPTKLAIVGPGKIAQDQHVPAILGNDAFSLEAVVSRSGASINDLPSYRSLDRLFADRPDLEAIAFCNPPHGRYQGAKQALLAGKHVLIEKPPTALIGEFAELEAVARTAKGVFFTTWHSQYNPGVEVARDILAREGVDKVNVVWRESVWRWHPGQDWIWAPGGFGVFDPAINAFSILTRIMPFPFFVKNCDLEVPSGCHTPIAGTLSFTTDHNTAMTAELDWREVDNERKEILITTGAGSELLIRQGGGGLVVNGVERFGGPKREYSAIYERFAGLIATGQSLIDAAPLHLVADAMMLSRRRESEPFNW